MKKPVLIIVAMFLALSALCQNAKFGIFYDSDGEQKQILPKHLIVISQKAVSSNISNDSQTITYGIQGSQSDNIVPADASFLIYLLPKKSDKNNKDNWWFLTAKDGEDFAIVSTPEYNSKKDAVVLVVKTAEGLINIKTKFPKNDVIKATVTPKGDYVYEVKPNSPLPAGNYCFYYKGALPGMMKFYDESYAFDFTVK